MDRWISVKEKMPPIGTLCVISCISLGYGRRMGRYVARYERIYKSFREEDGYEEEFFKTGLYTMHEKYENVTHWIQLPDLPNDFE